MVDGSVKKLVIKFELNTPIVRGSNWLGRIMGRFGMIIDVHFFIFSTN